MAGRTRQRGGERRGEEIKVASLWGKRTDSEKLNFSHTCTGVPKVVRNCQSPVL